MKQARQEIDLTRIAALNDPAALERYFAAHPEICNPEVAWRLAEASGASLRVDLPRAEALAAAALWVAEESADHPARGRALRARANVLYFQRRYRQAVPVYQEALAVFTAAGEPLEAAITRSSAIGSLSHLARYDRALEFARVARRVFEARNDRLHLARLEVGVGHVLSRQDRFPEAIKRFRAAQELFHEIGHPVDAASTLRNIAVCYQDLNDFHASLDAYREARGFCSRHGLTLVGLEIEYNIAYLYYLRGEYGEAIRLFEHARTLCREQGDLHHAALCDLDLAEIFLELNLVHDAEHLGQSAHSAFVALGMDYETAKALAYRALAAFRIGEAERALPLLEQSRRMFGRQSNRVWVAMTEFFEALILSSDARFEEADLHAGAALAGFADSGVPSRIALCEVLRARLALGLEDLPEARKRACVALLRATETGRPLLEFQAHLVCGQVEEACGKDGAALAAFARAHRSLERLRGQLQTDELKIAFFVDKRTVYEGLVAITLRRDPGSATAGEAAFRYVETAKSRSLADLLSVGAPGAALDRPADASLLDELKELRQELSWYYRQISAEELVGGERSRRRLNKLLDECGKLERALLRNLRRLQTADAQVSSLHGSLVTDLPALREALPEDACLVEFFAARGVIYRFTVDRRHLDVAVVGELAPIRGLYYQLQFQLGKFRIGGEYLERFGEIFYQQTLALLEELHTALLGGWKPPAGTRHLVFVPHDFLHQLPFHALRDGRQFLIDRWTISYAPSATVFRLCCDRRVEFEERSLILGVPDERAPKIRDEVEAVAALLPGSRLLIGAEATRKNLSRLGAGCRFVHIATHGLYRKDNPIFSAIQLGDARLNLLDLYDIRLDAELAVLSGCGTGLSNIRGSDELVGLTRGLLFAGARSVLATLWDVNDESTAEFMRLFYGRLTADSDPAGALREAMLAVRERYPHPYFWAPFVLTGPASTPTTAARPLSEADARHSIV